MTDDAANQPLTVSVERTPFGDVEAEIGPAPQTSIAIHLSGRSRLEWGTGAHRLVGRPRRGDVTIVPQGRTGSLRVSGGACEVLKIGLPEDAIRRWADAEHQSIGQGILIDRFAVADPLVQSIGLTLLREAERPGTQDTLYRDALSNALIAHLVRRHSEVTISTADTARVQPLSEPRARRTVAFMEDCLGAPVTLADLAREMGVSPSHFGAQFRSSFGRTPAQYLTWLRLDRARAMLEQTRVPIAEIASVVGFRSPSHFTQAFRLQFGETPTAWRAGRGQ